MEAHKLTASERGTDPGFGKLTNSRDAIAVEGLEDLFKWASEVVADGEEGRVKRAREQRIRRQVMEAVQRLREQQAIVRAAQENSYLQRRLIAVLTRLQEITEENSSLKQTIARQSFSLERVPALEGEIKRLKDQEFNQEEAQAERKELLNALSKLKVERDYLDELLRTNEEENARLAELLADARAELESLKARRWWHIFFPRKI